ncbi:MAG: T9SS type A sorting domain-containing protein, partial [Prolixibacteraceae bacterium]|nr:T9SS type A sorting domain-containing protein [Prolixibacteraceae bacterium]
GIISYCSNDGLQHKMYKTTNGGQTWESISTTNYYQQIKYIPAVDAYCSMNINGGLSYSCDDGLTWTTVSHFNNIKLRSVNCSSSGKIYLGGLGYIFYSSPLLTVSENEMTIEATTNSTKTFDILSNTNWTVISNQTWLAVSSTSGSGNSTITLTAAENPTTATRTATITVSGAGLTSQIITVIQDAGIYTSGIIKIRKNPVSMFPNPVTDELTIDELSENATISVFDLNGKLLVNRIAKSTTMKINLSILAKGFYSIIVTDKKGIKASKLIKQ